MRKHLALVLLVTAIVLGVLMLAACGGDSTGPEPEPDPGNVKVVAASQVKIYQGARVTVSLRNDGGPGVFKVEFWSNPRNQVGGAGDFWGASDPVEVAQGWSETVAWDVTTSATGTPVDWIIVQTRDPGSAAYRQTARHDF